MSLAGRLEAGPPRKRKPCLICHLIATLPDVEAQALERAVAKDSGWSAAKLYGALVAEGLQAHYESDQFIGEHRRDCT